MPIMKKIFTILLVIVAFVASVSVSAQDNKSEQDQARKERWEKFRREKQDFYTRTMELTDEQATKFFPIYEEMEKKCFEAAREVRREAREIMKGENIPDEKYRAAADRAAALDAKQAAIKSEYYKKFCEILSPRQQFLYHRCEVEFQKATIKKKHHHEGHKKTK